MKTQTYKTALTVSGALAGCMILTGAALAGPPTGHNGKGGALAVADAAALSRAIKAAHGKVVMVNFWATWCGPCVAEFPELVVTYNNHKAQGLQFFSVSGDEPADQGKAATFLKRMNAPATAFIKPKGDLAAWAKSLDARWDSGSLPRTYLIDRNGKVRKMIDGKIDAADLDKALTGLLAEKPGAGGAASGHGKGPLGS